VLTIGEGAFYECRCLTSAPIPNSVLTIGPSAFKYCQGLTSVTIPTNVTTIGNNAFEYCNITTLIIGNSETNNGTAETTIGNEAFQYCGRLTSVTIGYGVKSIGDHAFYGCEYLENLIIGKGVTSILSNAFSGCSRLSTITSLIENPFKIPKKSSSNRIFDGNVNNNATLYIPNGTIDKYKSTDGWKDFAHIVEMDTPTGISTTSVNQSVDEKYYNISGAQVAYPTKGIYIKNGKKVLMK
jgi:hypothetical protein